MKSQKRWIVELGNKGSQHAWVGEAEDEIAAIGKARDAWPGNYDSPIGLNAIREYPKT